MHVPLMLLVNEPAQFVTPNFCRHHVPLTSRKDGGGGGGGGGGFGGQTVFNCATADA